MAKEGKQRLLATPLFRFIKTYPRISAAAVLAVATLFIILPGSGQDKLAMILRTLALGFLIAFGFCCFRTLRR